MAPLSPSPLSYAEPTAADPRLTRWGIVALATGAGSIVLSTSAIALVGWRLLAARTLISPEAAAWNALLHSDSQRLAEPNVLLVVIVSSLLLLAIALSLRLMVMGLKLLRHQPALAELCGWAKWRIALSLLLPVPALLLGQNLQLIHAQHAFGGGGPDARVLVGAALTALAWAELLLPVIILRRRR